MGLFPVLTVLVVLLWGHHGEGEASGIAPPSGHTPQGVGEPKTATANTLLLLLLPVVELVEKVTELIGRGNSLRGGSGEGQRREAADERGGIEDGGWTWRIDKTWQSRQVKSQVRHVWDSKLVAWG